MTEEGTKRTTRAQRLAMPLSRDVVEDLAVEHGACIRPVQLRRTHLDTGDVEQVLVPCGHTLASVCPSCAERARALRTAQCREGGAGGLVAESLGVGRGSGSTTAAPRWPGRGR